MGPLVANHERRPDSTNQERNSTAPRPGHADLAGMMKYDTTDARDVLERASARETAARTVVGYLAKQVLRTIDIDLLSHVVAIGKVTSPDHPLPTFADLPSIDASEVRCFHPEAAAAMIEAIEGGQSRPGDNRRNG